MIISQEDQVLKELFYKALVETCLMIIGNGVIISKRVAQLTKILGVFQMLSFVMPPYKDLGLPWNYSDLQFLWMGLGFMSRIYYPTDVIGLPEIGITLVLFLYLALIFIQLFIFVKVLTVVKNGKLSTDHQAKIIKPIWIKVENILRYILLELAFIPTLLFLTEIVPAIEKKEFSKSIAYVYYGALVMMIVLEIIIDSVLLQKLNWSLKSDNIISMPRYILSVRLVYLTMVLVTNEVTYKDHYFVYCSVLMGVGLFGLNKFVLIQPYYSVNLNMFESYKAVVVFLAGFLLLIMTFNGVASQHDYSVTSVYLLTIIPSMIIISDFIKKRRYTILNISSTSTNLNQFFLQLYHTSKNILTESDGNESQNLNCLTDIEQIMKMHLTSSTKNGFIYLWTIYYKMNLGDWNTVHILFSEARKIENSWETMIYLQECKQEFMKCLRNNIDEWEAHSYMMFRQHLKAILKDDQKGCELLIDLFYELLSRNTDTAKLSAFVVKVTNHTQNTKDYYYRLLKVFERNAQLLEYFAGYLDFVENTFASKDVYLRARKAREEQDVRSNFKEELVNLFNSNNMILTISLEAKSMGRIIWVNNASLLGYSDLELEKEDFAMLIPYKATCKEDMFFAGIRDIWSAKDNLYLNQKQFFMKRDGYMNSVHTKKRLVNTDTNKLIMIIALRINYDGLETAYLTEDGRFIYSMTSGMNTFLKEALGKTDSDMWTLDILSEANLCEWKTGVKLCGHFVSINSKGETSYVEAITSEVFDGDFKCVKCIQLHGKLTGKDSEFIKIKDKSDISPKIPRNTHHRITFEDIPCSYSSEINLMSEDPATTILSQRPLVDEYKELDADLKDDEKHMKEDGEAPSTSTIEIQHKLLRDMRKRIFARIGKYTKSIKIGVIIIFFLMLVSCFVIFHFLQTTIYENHSGSKDVANLTQLTKSTIDLAYQSKMMYNHNQGIALNRTLADIQANILDVVELIRDSSKELRDSNNLDAIQNAMRSDIFP